MITSRSKFWSGDHGKLNIKDLKKKKHKVNKVNKLEKKLLSSKENGELFATG